MLCLFLFSQLVQKSYQCIRISYFADLAQCLACGGGFVARRSLRMTYIPLLTHYFRPIQKKMITFLTTFLNYLKCGVPGWLSWTYIPHRSWLRDKRIHVCRFESNSCAGAAPVESSLLCWHGQWESPCRIIQLHGKAFPNTYTPLGFQAMSVTRISISHRIARATLEGSPNKQNGCCLGFCAVILLWMTVIRCGWGVLDASNSAYEVA